MLNIFSCIYLSCTFLMKYFSIPFSHFLIGSFFSPLNFESSLYILDNSLLSDTWFIFFFFQFVSFFFFHPFSSTFTEHTFCFVFDMVQYVNLYFSEADFDVSLKTFYLSTEDFCFSLSFIILLRIFKSIFHFELTFM